ncbi:hypothetical protein AB4Z52_35790 [Rhizobium sp. 2YAF20]|uniref:hypothetical protein n=1 Tax=Rhizobium sp. 2YAF20 TaxID=3233027 RepID=UPI003F94F0D2
MHLVFVRNLKLSAKQIRNSRILTFKCKTTGTEINAQTGKIITNNTFVDGAGTAAGVPKTIPYQPSGTVVLQGNAPVCGPACAAMVISDNTGASVSLQDVIGSLANGVRPTGVNALELSTVISNAGVSNTVEVGMLPSQLDRALSNGQTVIVNVNRHFFIVDSEVTVGGVRYYMTRDPYMGFSRCLGQRFAIRDVSWRQRNHSREVKWTSRKR